MIIDIRSDRKNEVRSLKNLFKSLKTASRISNSVELLSIYDSYTNKYISYYKSLLFSITSNIDNRIPYINAEIKDLMDYVTAFISKCKSVKHDIIIIDMNHVLVDYIKDSYFRITEIKLF